MTTGRKKRRPAAVWSSVVMQWWMWRPAVVAKAVVLPAAGSASLSIGLGLDGGVVAAAVNLVHLLFIGTVRRRPTSH